MDITSRALASSAWKHAQGGKGGAFTVLLFMAPLAVERVAFPSSGDGAFCFLWPFSGRSSMAAWPPVDPFPLGEV